MIEWLRGYYDKNGERIGYLRMNGTNVQNNSGIYLTGRLSPNDQHNHFYAEITKLNVLAMSLYNAIRQCVEATWMNDRDQYLVPNADWKDDSTFSCDCLIFSLFHGQNRISIEHGPNHWIPFTEAEVDAKECFQSHFMSDLLAGRQGQLGQLGQVELWEQNTSLSTPSNLRVSVPPCENLTPAARAVLDAGRELWRYYHAQPHANPNASYYDIRRHFQGTKATASGKEQMNPTSADETYNTLLSALRAAMKKLGAAIEPKVYEYGFLKK